MTLPSVRHMPIPGPEACKTLLYVPLDSFSATKLHDPGMLFLTWSSNCSLFAFFFALDVLFRASALHLALLGAAMVSAQLVVLGGGK